MDIAQLGLAACRDRKEISLKRFPLEAKGTELTCFRCLHAACGCSLMAKEDYKWDPKRNL